MFSILKLYRSISCFAISHEDSLLELLLLLPSLSLIMDYYHPLTDEESKTREDYATCPDTRSWLLAKPALKSFVSKSVVLTLENRLLHAIFPMLTVLTVDF